MQEPPTANTVLTLAAAILVAGCMGYMVGDPDLETLEPVEAEVDLQQDEHGHYLTIPEGEPLATESTAERQLQNPDDVEYLEETGEVTYPMAYEGDEAAEHEIESLYAFKDSICARAARDEFPDVLERRDLDWGSVGLTYVDTRWAVSISADTGTRVFGGRDPSNTDDAEATAEETGSSGDGTEELVENAPEYVETQVEWHAEEMEWRCTVPVVVRTGFEDSS